MENVKNTQKTIKNVIRKVNAILPALEAEDL